MAASDQEATNRRWHMTLLGVILVGAIVHHCVLFLWYVDDAAITFAYSRNLASGEGLVPFVGGERVEGYSNPAWMFFLAPFAFLGFDLIFIVRWLQPVLVAATVIVAYLAGREIFASLQEDDETGFARHGPLLAPAILAVSALFATWTSSGLEYALMDLLMALGIWRTLVELRTGEWPVSALMWLGVSLCRPEAILYAAAAGFCTMVGHFRTGRGIVPTVKWLLTFFVPFGLYHIWRYSYFAWEFPNTYYAKLERRSGFPFLEWRARTWTYTRDFAYNSGWGLFVPVWTLAATSHRGWRWSVAMAVGVVGSLVIALASPEQRLLVPALGFALAVVAWEALDRRGESNDDRPEPFVRALVIAGLVVLGLEAFRLGGVTLPTIPMPDRLLDVPPFLLVSFGAVLFGLSFEDHRVPGRPLLLSLCFAAVAFAMIAQWDWMQGYRWYAPAVGSRCPALWAGPVPPRDWRSLTGGPPRTSHARGRWDLDRGGAPRTAAQRPRDARPRPTPRRLAHRRGEASPLCPARPATGCISKSACATSRSTWAATCTGPTSRWSTSPVSSTSPWATTSSRDASSTSTCSRSSFRTSFICTTSGSATAASSGGHSGARAAMSRSHPTRRA